MGSRGCARRRRRRWRSSAADRSGPDLVLSGLRAELAELDLLRSRRWTTGLERARAIAPELEAPHPDPPTSHLEGLEHPSAVRRLGTTATLATSRSAANANESVISLIRTTARNVERWRDGAMNKRGVAAGMLEAARSRRRVTGDRSSDSPEAPRCAPRLSGRGWYSRVLGAGRRLSGTDHRPPSTSVGTISPTRLGRLRPGRAATAVAPTLRTPPKGRAKPRRPGGTSARRRGAGAWRSRRTGSDATHERELGEDRRA